MANYSLDANIILRLSLKDIEEQHRLARILIADARHHFIVSDSALLDYVYALQAHYSLPRTHIFDLVKGLSLISTITIPTYAIDAVHHYSLHPKLSINDCLMATSAQTENRLLVTFDRKLANQHEAAVLLTSDWIKAGKC